MARENLKFRLGADHRGSPRIGVDRRGLEIVNRGTGVGRNFFPPAELFHPCVRPCIPETGPSGRGRAVQISGSVNQRISEWKK